MGKNRVQFKKFKWQFYQTKNFNVFFNQGGQELAKFVMHNVQKKNYPNIEASSEYSLTDEGQISFCITVSLICSKPISASESDMAEYRWRLPGLVNNKMVIYFDANHANLKPDKIRQGIADVITKNLLFGDDLGEVAGNQTLLDLPYLAY